MHAEVEPGMDQNCCGRQRCANSERPVISGVSLPSQGENLPKKAAEHRSQQNPAGNPVVRSKLQNIAVGVNGMSLNSRIPVLRMHPFPAFSSRSECRMIADDLDCRLPQHGSTAKTFIVQRQLCGGLIRRGHGEIDAMPNGGDAEAERCHNCDGDQNGGQPRPQCAWPLEWPDPGRVAGRQDRQVAVKHRPPFH